MKKIIISFFIGIIGLTSCNYQKSQSSTSNYTISNGDLNNSFINDSIKELSYEQRLEQEKEKLITEGWEDREIKNGQLPDCYNFSPTIGIVNNYLEVFVGSSTDVVIKVMHLVTEKCVRYVFINSGTTYQIKNIPEGQYYLKIGYGKNWFSKVENEQCIGKFIRNPMYQKGDDIMDFSIQHTKNGYNIPSFRLELDVIESNITNSFNSQNITEEEFNK